MDSYLNHRVLVYRQYFDRKTADNLLHRLKTETEWLSPAYTNTDGSVVRLPRLTANYGDKSYNYSGLTFDPLTWTDLMSDLRQTAEIVANQTFNALVLQYYRNGNDRINWHGDDDPSIGQNPVIISMSFGDSRSFWLRSNDPDLKHDILKLQLGHGDLLVMQGDLQHSFKHKIPVEKDKNERINLTFRKILD